MLRSITKVFGVRFISTPKGIYLFYGTSRSSSSRGSIGVRRGFDDVVEEAAGAGHVVGGGVDEIVGHQDGPRSEHISVGVLDFRLVLEVAARGVADFVGVTVRPDGPNNS